MNKEEQLQLLKLNGKLIEAAAKGDLPLVQLLISQGADIYAKDDAVLKWASRRMNIKIVQYLFFDCQMEVKKKTKDWLKIYNQEETLKLIEKRDDIIKNYNDLKRLKNNSLDNIIKKVKI